jgi:hypothetical protein
VRARRLALAALLAGILVGAPAAHGAQPPGSVEVAVDRATLARALGERFAFTSTVTNRGSTPVTGLIAHLNVLSLRPGVYVDPEDWAGERTRYLPPIPAGGSTTVTWHMQAVNAGTFGIYVAVLSGPFAERPPITARTIELTVEKRTALSGGGVLPLALGIPALLGLLTLGLRLRRNDRRPRASRLFRRPAAPS